MKRVVTFIFFLTLTQTIFGNQTVRYDGFTVYRVIPKSLEAVEVLKAMEQREDIYDFWTSVRGVGNPVDIMVSQPLKRQLTDTFDNGLFDSRVYIPDVQELIDKETPRAGTPRALNWDDYYPLNEIYQFLRDLELQHSEVTLVTAGLSHEEREIIGVRVTFLPDVQNKTVFIESHIHAREWITSAVATWILNTILTTDDAHVRDIVRSHNWVFVPVFNPDGLAYTWTRDRLWRKTRTPYFLCMGVDANRNWGYHFNEGGSSENPCSNTYHGTEAFSDPSTNSTSQFISTMGTNLYAYISFHSYSQMMLIPYGYGSADPVDNYQELVSRLLRRRTAMIGSYDVGIKAAESLYQRYNTSYQVGNIVDLLYVASGGSGDWVKGTFGTRIQYTYELRDTGEHGFILPKEQIVPTAEETFDSLVTILEEFGNL